MEKFKFFPHTSDVRIEAYGNNLEECFENGALALFEIMTNTEKVREIKKIEDSVSSESLEELLYSFLEKLLIYHDSDNLLFKTFKIKIKKNAKYKLEFVAFGEEFDPKRHESRTLVKAITFHEIEIKENKIHFIVDI
ncbi:MAG: archease [archaeon]